MDNLLSNIKISVPPKIYNKDPESSDLGKRIIEQSIILIDKIGFEGFTFKKLGAEIGSSESSIYRYFESKHNLLLYLTSWYWAWLEYQFVMETFSIQNSEEKLKKGIEVLTRTVKVDSEFTHVDEILLNKIVVNENSKSFLTKQVDHENKEGYFVIYKRLVKRLTDMVKNVNTDYKYPATIASTIIDGALHQHFLSEHFVSITDCDNDTSITNFFKDLVFKTLKQ